MSEKIIDPNKLGEEIVKVLKTIFDPEIPVDIYELGLIYDVFVNEDNDVKILMTLILTIYLLMTDLCFVDQSGLTMI